MERRFSLLDGRGWLNVRESQGRAECCGELPDDKKGLYKGWLLGPEGRVLLGTFVPEEGVLRLTRTLGRAELERQGGWPPVGAEAALTYRVQRGAPSRPAPPGWTWTAHPAQLLGEPLLVRAAGKGGALLRREEGGFTLAYPFRTDRPFPLTPLFCFARVTRLEGAYYAAFPFRAGGCPRPE
ncbi:hypothetical protein [uncultured Flavonifractor sp.]|uniref:hypothetical protein n=1 Tax=uncultured Flavonifractor sp. TaxID=1193534 RepID=UPI00261F83FD|nr:hypothetical protein [uncultured Flavonifractor sp.]